MNNVDDDPAYAELREDLKAATWREQSRVQDAPHHSPPVPAGCEDVPVAEVLELPRYAWLDLGGMMG